MTNDKYGTTFKNDKGEIEEYSLTVNLNKNIYIENMRNIIGKHKIGEHKITINDIINKDESKG